MRKDLFDCSVRDNEAGVISNPPNVLLQRVCGQQVELQMLCAAPNSVGHFLRVGGCQHEHDVRRRLFERLQERCFSWLGEHVDFVEDVHLVATRRSERRLVDQVAHCIDAVVACRVEFMHVVARAAFDRQARLALAAGLALLNVGAVEDLGQNARRSRLACSPWA